MPERRHHICGGDDRGEEQSMSHRVEAWLRVPLVLVEGKWMLDSAREFVPQEGSVCSGGRGGRSGRPAGVHGRDCEAVLNVPPLPSVVTVGKAFVKNSPPG